MAEEGEYPLAYPPLRIVHATAPGLLAGILERREELVDDSLQFIAAEREQGLDQSPDGAASREEAVERAWQKTRQMVVNRVEVPEAAHERRRRQGVVQLVLAVRIGIVEQRGVPARPPVKLLVPPADCRLLRIRMHMQRQRIVHGKHLEHERKAFHICTAAFAEERLGIAFQIVLEQSSVLQPSLPLRMHSEPRLGLRSAVRIVVEHRRKHIPRTPGIVLEDTSDPDYLHTIRLLSCIVAQSAQFSRPILNEMEKRSSGLSPTRSPYSSVA